MKTPVYFNILLYLILVITHPASGQRNNPGFKNQQIKKYLPTVDSKQSWIPFKLTNILCEDSAVFNGVNVAIPDGNPTGVTNTQNITGIGGTVMGQDVFLTKVCFKIDHTWVGDLIITLSNPAGDVVVLLDRPGYPATMIGCGGENLEMCIVTGTGNEAENVCNTLPAIGGDYTAFNGADLDLFNSVGGSPNGTWKINVSDNEQFDTGTLVDWKLLFNTGPLPDWTSPGTICSNATPLNLNTLVTGTPGGTWSGSGVSGNTFNPTGLSGNISITYTVTDLSGCSNSQTNIINVIGGNPTASFSATNISLEASFLNSSSNANSWLWDFGDGTTDTTENPIHNYATAGTYTVTLTVTNSCGSNSTSQQITVLNCPNSLINGGFESGAGTGAWTEYSLTFGTPICSISSCGSGSSLGAHSGNFWAWFGGVAGYEEGSLSQFFNIPVNSTATLSFWLEMSNCDSPSDFLKVAIDSDTIFTQTASGPSCGQIGYVRQVINLNAYADGNPHNLTLISKTFGLNGGESDFFVDDVQLNICTPIGFSESPLSGKVSIVPVPARDRVSVHFTAIDQKNITIEVSDAIGRNVFRKRIPNMSGNHTEMLDISSWDRGLYLVRILSDDQSLTRKIVAH